MPNNGFLYVATRRKGYYRAARNSAISLKNYYPDIFVKSENKIIEVKSTRTFELDRKKNLCKRDGCISKGYNFNFYIWHKGKIKII